MEKTFWAIEGRDEKMFEHKKSPLTHSNELKGHVKRHVKINLLSFYNIRTVFAITPIQGECYEWLFMKRFLKK